MKPAIRVAVLAIALLGLLSQSRAQFKGQKEREEESSGGLIAQPPPSLLFGWFDPNKFSMHHTFDVSYMSFGGQGMSLSTYTNSMMYQFADNLNAQADVSMSYSPTNSSMSFGGKGGKDLSGIYLSRAQLNYRPWQNVSVQLQYQALPYGYYGSPFLNPMYRGSGF